MSKQEFLDKFSNYAGELFSPEAIELIYAHIVEKNLGSQFFDDFNLICKLFKVEPLINFYDKGVYREVMEYELDISPQDEEFSSVLTSLVSEDVDLIGVFNNSENEVMLVHVRDDYSEAA